ncbi:hypothetical protein [Marisediminicola sp. LYQ134]|uniref:hypothetical protein n=1 Tax=Marisediminicola sp. LYQ134 TaxID=3391061 RepID=UPI0039836FBA
MIIGLSIMLIVLGLLVLGSTIFGYSAAIPLLGQIVLTPFFLTAVLMAASRKMNHDRRGRVETHDDAPGPG